MTAQQTGCLASRRRRRCSVAAEADRLRRQGIDVVDLGAGEPDFPTPEHIKAAAHAAHRRATSRSTRRRRASWSCARRSARATATDYGVDFTAGRSDRHRRRASRRSTTRRMALFEDGDEVITHAPYWPTIPEQIKLAGATPVIVQTHAEDGFTIHAEPILDAITPRTKGIVINSPCNPTGALISEEATDGDRRCRGGARALDHRRRHLRKADLRRGAAQPAVRILVDRAARSHRPLQRRVEGLRDDRLALRLGDRAGKASSPRSTRCRATRRRTSRRSRRRPRSPRSPARRTASTTMLRRVPATRRDAVWAWLTADPRFTCLKPRGAFYLFPYAVGRARAGRRAHDRGVRRGAARGVARGADGGRGLRRARLLPHLVRDVARSAARRRRRASRSSSRGASSRGAVGQASRGTVGPLSATRHAVCVNPVARCDHRRRPIVGRRLRAHRRRRRSTATASTRCRSAIPPISSLLPGGHRRDRGHRAAVQRPPRAAGRPRRRHRLHRRRRPVHGGVVLSMERFNRILEIDEENLLAVVQPNVITRDLQDAVEARGLFYPPDPASLKQSSHRRQRRRVRRRAARGQVRHDEALRAGARSRAADRRNHPHRLEGGEERRRLRPDAAARRVGGHARDHHRDHAAAGAEAGGAGDAAGDVRRHRRGRRRRVAAARRARRAGHHRAHRPRVAAAPWSAISGAPLAPAGTGAMLIIEVDGVAGGVEEEAGACRDACRAAGATRRAARARRRPSATRSGKRAASCRTRCARSRPRKINHDVVVPRGRVPAAVRR